MGSLGGRRVMVGGGVLLAAVVALAVALSSASAAPVCTITGTPGNNVIRGTSHADVICGLGGNDVINGAGGNDTLIGGDGNDTLIGGTGADTFDGGNGLDIVHYDVGDTTPVHVTIGSGADDGKVVGGVSEGDDVQSSVERVRGGGGDDVLVGDGGNNQLFGMGGDDTLEGGGGGDLLVGGAGADTFDGGPGRDAVDYGPAETRAVHVTIGDGPNDGPLIGGTPEGDDVQNSVEVVRGGAGDDVLTGDDGDNALYGRGGADELHGAGGQDLLVGGPGADTLDGGTGADTVDYLSGTTDPVVVTIGSGADDGVRTGGVSEGDDVQGSVEDVLGGAGDDELTGDGGDNALWGRGGDDTLTGAGGNDLLKGSTGADSEHGEGDGAAVDSVECGKGTDAVFADASDTIGAGCENAPPVANDDAVTRGEDASAAGVDVLANDADQESRQLSVASIDTTGTTGTATLNAGNVSYDPNGQFEGLGTGEQATDTFTYKANDGTDDSAPATVTVTIDGANDAPTANDDAPSTDEDHSVDITPLGNDTDPDTNDHLTITGTGGSPTGSVSVDQTKTIVTYDPGSHFQSLHTGETASDSFTYDISDGHGGTDTATVDVTITGVDDNPVAGDDSSSTVGNTLLAFGPTAAVPAGQAGRDDPSGNVLANDTDPEGDTVALDLADSSTNTPNGGSVSWFSDGSFAYTPKAGYTGTDTLTYAVTDGHGGTATGHVSVSVAGKVWYVKNNQPAGGDGRSTWPFDTLAEAQSASGTGDTIYVFKGDGTTSGQASGIALQDSQQLLGEAVDLKVGGDTLFTGNAANRPAIAGNPGVKLATSSRLEGLAVAGSGGPAVCTGTDAPCGAAALADSSTITNVTLTGDAGGLRLIAGTGTFDVSNFTITTTGGTGLSAAFINTLNVPDAGTANVSATSGPAVDIQHTGGGVNLDTVSSTNSTGDAINLTSNGTGTFSATGGSLTGAAGNDVDINGGSGDVTYPGTLGDSTGNTATITGRTGGAITLAGNINDSTDAGGGIAMSANSGGSTTFSGTTKTLNTGTSKAFSSTGSGLTSHTTSFTGGGLDIDTTTANGFDATGAGTVAVTGTGNTITSTTGTALNVQSTNIGASGLTFQSISAGGATGSVGNGIVLDSTGSAGGLTVSGNGTAGSGGTIQHKLGPDGSLTQGIGIFLNNTSSVSLARMQLNDFDNFAIRGFSVAGFTLSDSTISGSNGTSTASDEGSLGFTNLTGSASLTNDNISGGAEDDARLVSGSTGSLTFTASNSTFSGAAKGFGLLVSPNGAQTSVTASNNTFSGNFSDGLAVLTSSTGTGQITFSATGNTVTNNTGAGIDLGSGAVTGSQPPASFTISGNTVTGQQGSGINVFNGAGGTWTGHVTNNHVGDAATADSGSKAGWGVVVKQEGAGTLTADVSSNTIRQIENWNGIEGSADTGSGTLNLTMTGNDVDTNQLTSQDGIFVNSGVLSTDTSTTCVSASGNTSHGAGTQAPPPNGNGQFDAVGLSVLNNDQNTTVKIAGLPATTTDDTTAANYLAAHNTLSGPGGAAFAQHNAFSTGFTAVSSCPVAPSFTARPAASSAKPSGASAPRSGSSPRSGTLSTSGAGASTPVRRRAG